MRPSLPPGRVLVAHAPVKKLRIGDVVVLRHNGRELLKRIHELDGERVYVLGDNPGFSTDSRDFGWLPVQSVVGRVVWPRTRAPSTGLL